MELKKKAEFTAGLLLKDDGLNLVLIESLGNQKINEMLGEQIFISTETGKELFNSFDYAPLLRQIRTPEQLPDGPSFVPLAEDYLLHKFTYSSAGGSYIVIVAAKNNYLGELNLLKIFLISGFILSLGIVYFSGKYFSAAALGPVEKIVNEVEAISATNLHKRLDIANGEDELAHLSITFNRLLERLETSFALQRNFVANASHELRTPLSAITAQLEVTLMNTRSVEEYKLVMQSILDDIREMNQLSEGLFDLTLASRDVSLMKFSEVRLDEVLMQSRGELLKKKPEYKINIHIGELPDNERMLMLHGKEHLLKSTLRNLMDNACKYSPDKTADVMLAIENQNINIRIMDHGIGIPEDYMDKLFTPLLRAGNVKHIQGHGLGLALSKKIVELHHGKISVDSEIGKGTRVLLTFPALL